MFILDIYFGFLFYLFCCLGQRRTWIVGDSIIARAGKHNTQLHGGGTTMWDGIGGAKCRGVINRLTRLLHRQPFPTSLIMHLGTNDIFYATKFEIKDNVESNLEGIRRLLPNTRLIWSDILVRLQYSQEKRNGAGKRNSKSVNKKAHKVMKESLGGDNKVVVHSHIFQSGRKYYQGAKLYEYDSTHPTEWGLECLRRNWSSALVHFNQNPVEFVYPPGSIRPQ